MSDKISQRFKKRIYFMSFAIKGLTARIKHQLYWTSSRPSYYYSRSMDKYIQKAINTVSRQYLKSYIFN